MPALEVFGRRSRVVGSDDLYCPALLLFLYQLPLSFVCILYASLWRRCSSTAFDATGLPFWYLVVTIPLVFFRGCIYLMIMQVSAKGTIVDHERRVLMPRILQVHVLWSLVLLTYGLVGVYCWYAHTLCHPDARFVLVISGVLLFEVLFTFALGMCLLSVVELQDALQLEQPPLSHPVDPYGNAFVSERQSLLDGTWRP